MKKSEKKSVYDVKSSQGNSTATLVANTRGLQRRIGDRLPQLLVIVAVSDLVKKIEIIKSEQESIFSFCMVGILRKPTLLFI